MLISIPNKAIIDEFYSNFKRIPDGKFQFISDTQLKQYTFEHDYCSICGSNKLLWNQFLKLFQPHSKDCKLNYLQHIDFEQIYVTAIYTNAAIEEPQHAHIDFTWEVLLLCSRRRHGHVSSNKPGLKHGNMLYTAHMPLSSDGSYIYIYMCIYMVWTWRISSYSYSLWNNSFPPW